jgi:hypothetical protein
MIKAWMNSSAIKMDWMDGSGFTGGNIFARKNLPQAKQTTHKTAQHRSVQKDPDERR